MRQALLATCAISLLLSTAYAAAETPPFAPSDSGVTKVLKLVAWIGSLNDLSAAPQILPSALGLPADPKPYYYERDGKQAKDWTDYLDDAPVWPGAKSTIQYSIPEADGPAGTARATIFIRLNKVEACVHMADMISSLGNPAETYFVTDGGGEAYGWVLRQTPWKTVVSGYFGRNGRDCAGDLSVGELR